MPRPNRRSTNATREGIGTITFQLATRLQSGLDGTDETLRPVIDDVLAALAELAVRPTGSVDDPPAFDLNMGDTSQVRYAAAVHAWAGRRLAGHAYWAAARCLEAATVLLDGETEWTRDAARLLIAQAGAAVGAAGAWEWNHAGRSASQTAREPAERR